MMTRKQLKAIKRHKNIVRKRNIRTNNMPRTHEGTWFKRFAAEYGIQ